MAFKKVRYDIGENVVRIKIEDETRRIIDTWTLMMSDLPNWFNIIKEKYGLKSKEKDKSLDWAR